MQYMGKFYLTILYKCFFHLYKIYIELMLFYRKLID